MNLTTIDPAFPSRLLLVDDDASFRTRLQKAIETRGFQTGVAGTVAQAIEIARVFQPDGAIVDLKMPGGQSGLDLVEALIKMFPDIRIVVLTGFGSIATAVEAVKKGAINYLNKPLDADQILAAFEPDQEHAAGDALDITPSLARVEWEHIQRVLEDCDGNISMAARRLGIHRRSLQRKLGKLPPLE